jgi:hypothetical protein
MQTYVAGTPVNVSFDLVDGTGVALAPATLRYQIVDEEGTVLWAWAPLTPPADGQPAIVTVLGGINMLTPPPDTYMGLTSPAMRGYRSVLLEVTTTGGQVVQLEQGFLLKAQSTLVLGVNTIQTYGQAILQSQGFGNDSLAGWNGTEDRDAREKALIESWQRILRLPIGLQFDDTQSIMVEDAEFTYTYGPFLLKQMRADQIQNLHPLMRQQLQLAQLVEADEIMQGDPTRVSNLPAGVAQRKVGDSLDVYRGIKPLDLPVSLRAIRYIERWVRFTARMHRAG